MHKLLQLFFILISLTASSQDNHNILDSLDKTLANKKTYLSQKHGRIKQLKKNVHKFILSSDSKNLYKSYLDLFEEYKSFKYDSAYYYIDEAKHEAYKLHDKELIAKAKIKEGFVLLSSGLFKEALDTLCSISDERLDIKARYDYYSIK